MSVELEPPRWKDGPPICPVANLPAFQFPKQLFDFMTKNAPSIHVVRTGKCEHCQCYHAETRLE